MKERRRRRRRRAEDRAASKKQAPPTGTSVTACLSLRPRASTTCQRPLRPDLIVSDWPIAVHKTGPRVQLEWTPPPLISVVLGSASAFSTRTWQLKFTSSGSSISGWGPRREERSSDRTASGYNAALLPLSLLPPPSPSPSLLPTERRIASHESHVTSHPLVTSQPFPFPLN